MHVEIIHPDPAWPINKGYWLIITRNNNETRLYFHTYTEVCQFKTELAEKLNEAR